MEPSQICVNSFASVRRRRFDPVEVDVIMRRYEAATGNPAVLRETDETFEALARLRLD